MTSLYGRSREPEDCRHHQLEIVQRLKHVHKTRTRLLLTWARNLAQFEERIFAVECGYQELIARSSQEFILG